GEDDGGWKERRRQKHFDRVARRAQERPIPLQCLVEIIPREAEGVERALNYAVEVLFPRQVAHPLHAKPRRLERGAQGTRAEMEEVARRIEVEPGTAEEPGLPGIDVGNREHQGAPRA